LTKLVFTHLAAPACRLTAKQGSVRLRTHVEVRTEVFAQQVVNGPERRGPARQVWKFESRR